MNQTITMPAPVKKRTRLITPEGWPEAFTLHYTYQPKRRHIVGDVDEVEIVDITINGESVLDFMESKGWLDWADLEKQALADLQGE